MIYAQSMTIRLALFFIPMVAAIGLVLLLNGLNAGAGVAITAYSVIAVSTGAALGCFADRLPEVRPLRKARQLPDLRHDH